MANVYNVNGEIIPINGGSSNSSIPSVEFDRVVKGIAHRGYSHVAPENTIPAYKEAKVEGFFYVETDVQQTSDGVPVCLHDGSIDRTSNGTGNIWQMTFDQVRQYDFGSWKSAEYTGTQIPSFEEFITLCRDIVLHPYIELKASGMTVAQVRELVDMVEAVGMKGKVTWISFYYTELGYVVDYDPTARIGVLAHTISSSTAQDYIDTVNSLRTGQNEVFIDTSSITTDAANICKNAGIPMEVWTTDSQSTILNAAPYITGFTSDSLVAEKVLYDANIT